MATSSDLFLVTIYNQSQLAERKQVARYWSINTGNGCSIKRAPLSISYYNEISGGHIGRAVVRRRSSAGSVLTLWSELNHGLPAKESPLFQPLNHGRSLCDKLNYFELCWLYYPSIAHVLVFR